MSDTTDADELIDCPRSLSLAASIGFNVHQGTRREIEENSGICNKCKRALRHQHLAWKAGMVETPADFAAGHRHVTLEADHAGVVGDELHPAVEFDFASIDADELRTALDNCSAEGIAMAADFLGALLVWLWAGHGTIKTTSVKLAVFTSALRPDLLGDRTYKQLGQELGVTRANLSKHASRLSDALQFKFTRARSDKARLNMRLARLEALSNSQPRTPGKESFDPNRS